jgi:hypothetical protein
MTADRLLRLYTRAWRDRYGDEFLETAGEERLHPQQVIDIVAGAIDAWLSPRVRRITRPVAASPHTSNGGTMLSHILKADCRASRFRYTKRDALIGAGVMLASTFLCSIGGVIARRNGMPVLSEFLLGIAFPGSLMLSMPFTFMKGQPWRAQVAIVGGTMSILMLLTYLAARS